MDNERPPARFIYSHLNRVETSIFPARRSVTVPKVWVHWGREFFTELCCRACSKFAGVWIGVAGISLLKVVGDGCLKTGNWSCLVQPSMDPGDYVIDMDDDDSGLAVVVYRPGVSIAEIPVTGGDAARSMVADNPT